MTEDSINIKQSHEQFIQQVCESEVVIGLESEEGFATSSSNTYEDENDNPVPVLCFWSDRALAEKCVKDGWKNYALTEIPLEEFLENWCIGMENDELLVGTNFDQNMFGFEADPLELILEIIAELERTGKKLDLEKYKSLVDLKTQVAAILE